jgi:hypothetical protein
MATPGEYPVGGYEIIAQAEELLRTGALSGIPYGNVTLTTPQPRFTDGADPDMIVLPEAYTGFWPGGGPIQGKEFATVATPHTGGPRTNSELADEIRDIRNALLHASISDAAISRIPADKKAAWERAKRTGEVPLLLAESQCALFGLPLALVQTSRIVRSSIIPEDSRIMHMWYPAYTVSPKPVIAKVRKVVKQIIQDETI